MSLLFLHLIILLILLLSCYIPTVTWAYTTTNVGMYNKPDNKPVVVLGATGKVGRLVVSKLLKKGVPVRAMCRDVDKGRSLFPKTQWEDPSKLTLVRGDVTDPESLSAAIEGCGAVVSVHGTVHLTPWYKMLLPFYWSTHAPLRFKAAQTHPYFTNFIAMQDVVSLCEKHGVERVVRLTGLSCAFPPWNPVSVIFNALLSFSARYHRMGEEAVRGSEKVKSFVIRPGGLSDEERDPEKTKLQVDFSGNLPPPARVGRSDVADLAVLAATTREGVVSSSPDLVAAVRWVGSVPPKSQGSLSDGAEGAEGALEMAREKGVTCKPSSSNHLGFAVFHGLYVYAFLGVVAKLALALGGGLVRFGRSVFL
mmetsp:Transcript_8514/g.17632  ORF Transcript_8514/g.17632 Transcript_8514/m.17632 type:complete len:365 (-) Transcript_8514:190-1284(-)